MWIETAQDQTRFEEHKVSTEENRKAECFIESKTGTGFNVVVRLDPQMQYDGFNVWCISIDVDGQNISCKLMGPWWDSVLRVQGHRHTSTSVKPFQFGQTQFTGIVLILRSLTLMRGRSV